MSNSTTYADGIANITIIEGVARFDLVNKLIEQGVLKKLSPGHLGSRAGWLALKCRIIRCGKCDG
jgi:hypothetical protein